MHGNYPSYTTGDSTPSFQWGWWEPYDRRRADRPKEEIQTARANSLISTARALENAQREVHEQNLWAAQLYSNRELAAFDWGNSALYRASLAPIQRSGENLVLMVVDTLVAQIGKNRPKARPMTRGASWKLRRQAKKLDKFLYGEFIRNRVYEEGKRIFRDACIFGFGALYVGVEDGRLCVERVFPDDLLVDQMEVVAAGKARHFYRRRVLPVEVVASTYYGDEDREDVIERLQLISRSTDYLEYRSVGDGYVVVVEGWQLASGGREGRHVVAVQNELVVDEEYGLEVPPFVFYHWQAPLSGFYSPSAVEQCLPYQIRLNEINDVIRDAQDLMGRPRILVAEGSRVNPYEVDNLVARFIKYTGIKPEAVTWPAIAPEIYNERDRQVRICLEQFGISNMAAKTEVPQSARFDSSAAFREFNAIQDDRLADPAQRFERFYLDLAELMIKRLRDSGANPKTIWSTGGGKNQPGMMEVISWEDIDLDESSYVLQLEATSVFDSSPSAIRDELEKQLAMGLITPEQYRLELSSPDDQAELSLQAAAAADIRRVISLLEDGQYESPTPVQDLVNGVQLVSLALLRLSEYDDDDPDTRAELANVKSLMLDWLAEARGILEMGAEQPNPMQPAEPEMATDPSMMPPGGMPAPMAGPPGQIPPEMMGGMPGMAGPMGPPAVPVPENAGLGTAINPNMPI
jgi:hypothetical protein